LNSFAAAAFVLSKQKKQKKITIMDNGNRRVAGTD
jgi:hypothetical protein